MALRSVIVAPDLRLKVKSKPLARVGHDARRLMDDMLETMYAARGVGLAAVQIGMPKRIIVMDLAKDGEPQSPQFFVNPEILWQSDERALSEEGCLSVPDFYEEVERPARIRARYLDYEGALREVEAEGLLALCLQHEMDHLEGILFVDRISKLKRDIILRKLVKAKRQGVMA